MMDNVLEKLVELLDEARAKRREICYAHSDCNSCVFGEEGENCGDKMIADHLIAHGVTVQECGEWQREEQSPSGVFWFECSECHTKWGYGAVLHMKYCPNCGAKMKPLLPPKGE